MNSLLGYGNGSDDDLDESPDNRPKMDPYLNPRAHKKPVGPSYSQDDTNYDEVQMSLSEDSDCESKFPQKSGRDRAEGARNTPKGRTSREDYSRDRRDDRRDDRERSHGPVERTEDRPRYRDKDEVRSERPKSREEERDKPKREEDRTRERCDRSRDEDRMRDRRDDRRDGSRERHVGREERYRKDRDRRRSRSPRERKRSRSPRRGERSRSRSRERGAGRGRGGGGFQRRFDRGGMNKSERNVKAGPEAKAEEQTAAGAADDPNKARFFMPGITGRFRDQIEKRKLLWQKKEPESKPEAVASPSAGGSSRTTKVWEATTFAQDTDGKVANKFKRLMGIRGAGEGTSGAVEVLKKQEEMFTSMEQQYEVARTATHTMRGVGLGFGSYPR